MHIDAWKRVGLHVVDTQQAGLILCPNKDNVELGWTWDGDGFTGLPPPNCPACGIGTVRWFYSDETGSLHQYPGGERMDALPTVHEVKCRLDWHQNQPYCPEDLDKGPCPGEGACPGLRHKTSGWVIQHIRDAIQSLLSEQNGEPT